jgi:DNA-binding NtrC family response regulator
MTMHEMTGLELASEIHKISPKMPTILLTGYEKDIEQTKTLTDYGICKLLIKPVRLADMAATINDVIISTTA